MAQICIQLILVKPPSLSRLVVSAVFCSSCSVLADRVAIKTAVTTPVLQTVVTSRGNSDTVNNDTPQLSGLLRAPPLLPDGHSSIDSWWQ